MKYIIRLTAIASFLLFGAVAQAELVNIVFDGSECGGQGVWGKDCIIVDPDGNEISPFLGKWDSGDGEVTSEYGEDNGFDWDLMTFYSDEALTQEITDWNDLFNLKEAYWSYAGSDQLISFWAAKAGNGFILYFDSDGDCTTANSVSCMQGAQFVTSGYWSSATLESNLSHLSFYNGGGVSVPEPSTLALFGLGLIGIGVAARRRKDA